nr:ribonuclease H-like domain-containing protein [Tanacetum cinerariifolium]
MAVQKVSAASIRVNTVSVNGFGFYPILLAIYISLMNKDLQVSKDPQVVGSVAKLPILNPNEFDLWKMRIEQYFLMTDYSLWKVILNGDSPIPTRVIYDAKSLMEATEKRFSGNKETKKVQKTLLKQQYKNFTGSSSRSPNQIHDKLQKLISQLEILGESLSQEINLNTNESVSAVASVSAASTKVPISALPIVMVLEAMIGAFKQKKNQATMPSWHSPPQVLLVLII